LSDGIDVMMVSRIEGATLDANILHATTMRLG